MNRGRQGFTLIELVASAALMSIMMVVLSSVLFSITRQTRALEKQGLIQSSPGIAIETIRDDLMAARGMLINNDGISLRGFFPPSQTPQTIRYRVQMRDEYRVLVRENESGSDWIWAGVGDLQIRPLGNSGADDRPPIPLEGADPLPSAPELFRVTLTDQLGRVLWRHRVQHHGT